MFLLEQDVEGDPSCLSEDYYSSRPVLYIYWKNHFGYYDEVLEKTKFRWCLVDIEDGFYELKSTNKNHPIY